MASVLDSVHCLAGFCSSNSSNSSLHALRCDGVSGLSRRRRGGPCRAMVQQAVQGASTNYAKEMERLSTKESLSAFICEAWLLLLGVDLGSMKREEQRSGSCRCCGHYEGDEDVKMR
ncbi:hypothetical protein Syun_015293 [Stephania yunnanensis]|uniref:Uncharacterized protein n=1 Tax=Stephania yunnanensis TaxID=152371 RepID=A0AAP0JML9_9MAGN